MHRSIQAITRGRLQAGAGVQPGARARGARLGDRRHRPDPDHERQPRGFGGQSFIDSALRKIEQARKRIEQSGRDIRLEVDGGIKADNIARVASAGADTFVAGSAIFNAKDYGAVISQMRTQLAGVAAA